MKNPHSSSPLSPREQTRDLSSSDPGGVVGHAAAAHCRVWLHTAWPRSFRCGPATARTTGTKDAHAIGGRTMTFAVSAVSAMCIGPIIGSALGGSIFGSYLAAIAYNEDSPHCPAARGKILWRKSSSGGQCHGSILCVRRRRRLLRQQTKRSRRRVSPRRRR